MKPDNPQPLVVPPSSGQVLDLLGLQASAGGVAHLPGTIPHALYNPLKSPPRYLAIAAPGGLENFFDDLNTAREAGALDEATHKRVMEKYGIELLV